MDMCLVGKVSVHSKETGERTAATPIAHPLRVATSSGSSIDAQTIPTGSMHDEDSNRLPVF